MGGKSGVLFESAFVLLMLVRMAYFDLFGGLVCARGLRGAQRRFVYEGRRERDVKGVVFWEWAIEGMVIHMLDPL